MLRYLYNFIEYQLRNLDIKYYSLYNNQFLNQNLEEGQSYPAVALELVNQSVNKLKDRIEEGELIFRLHVVSENFISTRSTNSNIDRSLEHLSLVRDVNRFIDGKNSYDTSIPKLSSDSQFYTLSTIDHSRTQQSTFNKNLFITVLEFTCAYMDSSNYYYRNWISKEVTGVTGTTLNTSGHTWNLSIENPT